MLYWVIVDVGTFGLYICLFVALYFEVFLLISFLERRPSLKTAARPKHYPTVSMLVPCYNEEKTLAGTLDSLLALDYPQEKLEIMVIDDGSKDRTREIAERYAAQYPNRISYVHKENGGKYTALNIGIERSRGEIIGCLDADSFVATDALIEAIKRFEENDRIMALTPAMKVSRPHSMLERMQQVEYTFGIFYKKMFDNLSAINVLPGPFSLYKRSVFEKIGVFRHAHNTEDMEIAFRMHANGLIIANAHTAFVYTTVPNTVRALIKQRTRWSQGFLQNAQDYKFLFFNPNYGNFGLLVLPFSIIAFGGGIFSASFALYHIINATFARIASHSATGVPFQLPGLPEVSWFYLNTSMMTFVIIVVLSLTILAIMIGSRISSTRITIKSYAAYFALFGFIAPIWLVRAAWGALLARESAWR